MGLKASNGSSARESTRFKLNLDLVSDMAEDHGVKESISL